MQLAIPLYSVETRMDKQFKEFHLDNPKVYEELVNLARVAKARGRKKIGIKMLFEVVRWERYLNTSGDFKLNNNYHSRYSRLIMDSEPDLVGMFETRGLHT